MDKFDDFPINKKFKNQHKYISYLDILDSYLTSYLKRSRPLYNVEEFEKNVEKTFKVKFEDGRLPGW